MNPEKYLTYDIRIRAVNAILMGHRKIDVAKAYQIDYTALYRWCKRYNDSENFTSLERQFGNGRPNILNIESRKQLMGIIIRPASHFGYETDFWTCRRISLVAEQELKINISQPTR